MRSEREKGGDHAPGDSKGRSPWRAFGDFPRDGKVTRGMGRSAHRWGAGAKSDDLLPRGRSPSHIAGCRSLRSCKWTRRGPLQRSGKLGIIRRLFTIS